MNPSGYDSDTTRQAVAWLEHPYTRAKQYLRYRSSPETVRVPMLCLKDDLEYVEEFL